MIRWILLIWCKIFMFSFHFFENWLLRFEFYIIKFNWRCMVRYIQKRLSFRSIWFLGIKEDQLYVFHEEIGPYPNNSYILFLVQLIRRYPKLKDLFFVFRFSLFLQFFLIFTFSLRWLCWFCYCCFCCSWKCWVCNQYLLHFLLLMMLLLLMHDLLIIFISCWDNYHYCCC